MEDYIQILLHMLDTLTDGIKQSLNRLITRQIFLVTQGNSKRKRLFIETIR